MEITSESDFGPTRDTIEAMSNRRLEVLLMLKGLTDRIRRVREDLDIDHDPVVTGKLWKAGIEVQKAVRLVEEGFGGNERSNRFPGHTDENTGHSEDPGATHEPRPLNHPDGTEPPVPGSHGE